MSGNQNAGNFVKILSDVPQEQGFYFHLDKEVYTGVYATNLSQFSQLLKDINAKSIEFHLRNKDFENWIRFLGDDILPSQLATLRDKGLPRDALRSEIVSLVSKRLDELTSAGTGRAGAKPKKKASRR